MADQAAKRQSSTSQEAETSSDPTFASNLDIFSDDFASEPLEIHDRSSPSSPEHNVVSPGSASDISRRLGASRQTSVSTRESSRRSRGSLVDGIAHGFLSRRERPLSQIHTTSIGSVSAVPKTASTPHRSLSMSSNFSILRAQSPFQGAIGPSHPYGMYPQDIEIIRNPSSATNSTVRTPERSYLGPNGPTQPYAMYSQNTAIEDQVNLDSNMDRPMPGFPGQDRNFQRRFGHDGEEAADMTGPDGYTEQLPPYSRYVNDIPPKNGTSAPGGIEGEIRSQPGGSQDTLNTTQSRDFVAEASVADHSHVHLNPATNEAAVASEGGHFKERVKEKGRRRICFGKIPMWVFMVFLVLAAALLGAVIGGVLGRAGKRSSNGGSAEPVGMYKPISTIFATTVTTTSLVDAIPITFTTNLPSLPTGSYQISLDKLGMTNHNECLKTEVQEHAWDCNTKAIMDIVINASDPNQLEISFSPNITESSPNTTLRYGPQPPGFSGFATMTPMMARGDEGKGPAYVFHHQFDKLVILRENIFNKTYAKRWLSDDQFKEARFLEKRHYAHDDYIAPDDKPWYCFWNGTVLEGFIFVTEDLANATTTTTMKPDYPVTFSSENDTNVPMVTASAEPSISAPPSWPMNIPFHSNAYQAPEVSATSRWNKRQDTAPPIELTSAGTSTYPNSIKIEERRNVINNPQPYCQQMYFSGGTTPLPIDEDQKLKIDEVENPSVLAAIRDSSRRRRGWSGFFSNFRRSTDWSSSCGCVWRSL